ncbi:CaiB/BaiF CoA-transferase family protein [Candidatus Aquiluna sp. UB-MaderosW2red]|uniref:CaiB/BaiF CoA transferase family protein n=1 Tax=Candidatus Aquiluna sp. UB-MaderosW2red TaxID=1855377 RepID=UPI000B88C860
MTMAVRPLEGIRVIEMGSLIAGPYCGQILGDLGAEVIKIEPPDQGDALRSWGRQSEDGKGVWWSTLARNKQSVTCNLRMKSGQRIAGELISQADVLVENFRPGTLAKWNLAPEDLMKKDPRLIIAHVSGYGQDGPYAQRAGYAAIGEAMAGLRHLVGYPDRQPVRVGLSLGDSLAGLYSALGIITALYEREHSGKGQEVDTAIYESVLALTESLLADYAIFDVIRERTGPTLPGIAPSNAYLAADDRYVVIAANQDTVFSRLASAMGQPELAEDVRFKTHIARGERQTEIDEIVAQWALQHPSEDVIALLNDVGVPSGGINTAADILTDPHVQERAAVAWVPAQGIGVVPMPAPMPRLSRTPGAIVHAGPDLGADTDSVLSRILHLDPHEIAALRKEGAV